MTRTPSEHVTRQRRAVHQRRRPWLIPLIFGGFVLLVLAALVWSRGMQTTRARVPQPIATLHTQDFHSLVWSATEPNTVFFGHHQGLLKSTDGGHTWQPTALTQVDAMTLASSPQAPQRMYAAGHGIFRRSEDGGATWTAPQSQLQGADIHGFTQSPVDPNSLYAVVMGQGLFKSTDGGTAWTLLAADAPPGTALAMSVDGRTLFLGTATAVQQSMDGGATWTQHGTALPPNAQVLALAVQPGTGTLFAATAAGLYRQLETGSWTPTTLHSPILAVAMSPLQPQTVLAVNAQGEVYRSGDGGASWGGGTP